MLLSDSVAQALWTRLQAFELDLPGLTRTVSARIAEENGWTTEHTRRAVEEYRRFLFLTQVAGRPVSPSPAVDAVWHTHLLYSRDYWGRLCGEVLGGPLHHDPNPGGKTENTRHRDQYRDTLDDYQRVFGTLPPADLWPAADSVCHDRRPWTDLSGEHDVLMRLLAGDFSPSLLAFLTGGHERVTAVALAGLHQRGLVDFIRGKPVLTGQPLVEEAVPLTSQEVSVWRELARRQAAGERVALPMKLHHPTVEAQAVAHDLWPSESAQAQARQAQRASLWRSLPRVVLFLVGSGLMLGGHPLLSLVVFLLLFHSAYRAVCGTVAKPTARGRRLVEEFQRLVPRGTSVTLGSPWLATVVAAGVIGAASGGELASLKAAIAPRSGDGGGCGGGAGCGGGWDGGGCGGGCGGGGCGGS